MNNKFTIAVVVEHDQNGIKPVTKEILHAARNLGGSVIAYYFSESQKTDRQILIDNGADDVRFCIHPDFNQYIHETYSAGLLSEIKKLTTKKTKCIIVVHMAGYSCEMDKIVKFCKKNNIFLIEDCAHGLGTMYKKKHVGNFGIAGIFSFYPTRNW